MHVPAEHACGQGAEPPDTPLNALALYHLTVSHGSRSSGQSAVAKLAYVSRVERYAQRAGLQHVESANLPAWANDDASAFWQAVDEHSRANGRLYTEIEFALPKELSPQQGLELAREMAWTMSARAEGQVPFTMAVHSDGNNPHVHLVLSSRIDDDKERPTTKDWFNQVASKRSTKTVGGAPTWSRETDKDWLEKVRGQWADLANRALEKAQHQERVDHRSYARRGIDQAPTMHEGWAPKPRELRRRINSQVRGYNSMHSQAAKMIAEAERDLAQERARAARPAQQWTVERETEYQAQLALAGAMSRQAEDAAAKARQEAQDLARAEASVNTPRRSLAEELWREAMEKAIRSAQGTVNWAKEALAEVSQRWFAGKERKQREAELHQAESALAELAKALKAGFAAAREAVQQQYLELARQYDHDRLSAAAARVRQGAQEAARAAEQVKELAKVQTDRLQALEAARTAALGADRQAGYRDVKVELPPAPRAPEPSRGPRRGRGLER
jgi:hypothetical protein